MFRYSLLLSFAFLLAVVRPAEAQSEPLVEATLSSSFLVEGEKTLLTIELNNTQIPGWPKAPVVSPLTLRQYQQGNIQRNGRIREVFTYTISGIQPGIYTIPPFEIASNKGNAQTKPLSLRIFPADALKVNGLRLDATTVAYLSGIFVEKENPFLGEPQHVEAKVYLPTGNPHVLRMGAPQFADLEKKGIAAWRFDASKDPTGVLEREGIQFAAYTYKSSITALEEGTLTIGPGKAQPIFLRRVPYRGGFGSKEEALDLKFPAKSFNVRPLPAGAPEGFAGAVGTFSVTSNPLNRQIDLGDTVTVDVQVIGTGNIDQFPGPQLDDPDKIWKQFEMTAVPQGGERRSSAGTVKFSQVVRPTKNVPALPPYRFVYFDPVLEEYRTVKSPPQPLTITGEALAEAASLAFLEPGGRPLKTLKKRSATPVWAWQIIPGLILLGLIALRVAQHFKSKQQSSLPAREFQGELRSLGDLTHDRVQFYRAAANFATRWHGEKGYEEIFQTRDEICFAPQSDPEPLPVTEKNRVLNLLKQLSPLVLIALIFALQLAPAQALETDPAKAKAEILAAMESAPAPEHFHNLALCEEALGDTGAATLWAYRFQAQNGDASDLLQRLPGTRAFKREGTDWVSILPLSAYQQALAAAGWALALIIFVATGPNLRGRRWPMITLSIILGLGFALGLTGWLLYPKDVSFKPLRELSVVTQKSPLQSQPYEGGFPLREDVSGSLCHLKAERGGWSLIELPGGLSGWVPSPSVKDIVE